MDLAPPERWRRVEDLFVRALDMSPSRRERLLAEIRAVDEALHRDLSLLLRAHESSGSFLESLDGEGAAALLGEGEDADPETLGPYRVVRRLGRGGMGVVYLAHDPRLDRPVALKLLRTDPAWAAGARERLLLEARAASALDHPNIATVYEVGETPEGEVFIAMAYCPGEPLDERIARGPLPAREAAELGRQLARGLAEAHRSGVVHRDVKPANVLVSDEGRVRIVDFGVARVAGAGGPGAWEAVGTLAYMSPEQTRGGLVDPRTDVWALGAVLYEMLTGRRPFVGESPRTLVAAIVQAEPPPPGPDVPEPLARLVGRCLEKEPFDRPRDAAEVADALEAFLETTAGPRSGDRPWWRRAPGAAAAALVVAGVGAGLWALAGPDRSPGAGGDLVAVLPFVPATADTALERLGRELAVTLGASLDGVAAIRTVEPITVLGQPTPRGGWTPDERARLARTLGAGALLHGTLTRRGDGVRVDAVLYDAGDSPPRARTSVGVPSRDIATLTDSVTLVLLRNAWEVGSVPLSQPAALQTSSLAALEAYLEGELAIAGGRFRTAPEAFRRAIRADSTFWYAWWRYEYALTWHGLPVDSAIEATVQAHREDFPEPDRRLIEVRELSGIRAVLDSLRTITARFPTYVPGWFELGDELVHDGPWLGVSAREAAPVLDKVLALQPGFVPALTHRLWVAAMTLDTARTRSSVSRLLDLRYDTLVRTEWDLGTVDLYRYLDVLARSGGVPDPGSAGLGVSQMETYAGPWPPERIAPSVTKYGFHRAQVDLGRRMEASGAGVDVKAGYRWASALAWAGRGDWDSARVVAERYARTASHPRGPLWAYGLAAAGAWLGEVPPDAIAGLRALAGTSSEGATPDGRAELEWLEGLVACARGNAAALAGHRTALTASPGPHASRLEATLAAFQQALDGDGPGAARTLADLQWADADRAAHFGTGHVHPFLASVERLAAARGLLAAGDSAEAARLLVWHEADLPGGLYPLQAVDVVLGGAALPMLAAYQDARGLPESADAYRTLFRIRHDLEPEVAPRLRTAGMCGGS